MASRRGRMISVLVPCAVVLTVAVSPLAGPPGNAVPPASDVAVTPVAQKATLSEPPPAAGEKCCTVSAAYKESVERALRSGQDLWGETLLNRASGPTFDNIKDFLVPLNGGGIATGGPGSGYKGSTDTGAYYLPFTMPDGDTADTQASTDPSRQHYAFPLADGAGVMADYHVPCGGEPGNPLPSYLTRCKNFYQTQFFVGAEGLERFGQAKERAPLPRLHNGYLPVLDVDYTDAQGIGYTQQTFAARIPQTSSLVSYTRFTVASDSVAKGNTTLRVRIKDPRATSFSLAGNTVVSNDRTYLAFSGAPDLRGSNLSWDLDLKRPTSVTIAMLITPGELTRPTSVTSNRAYKLALSSVDRYWSNKLREGASISVPEKYVMDAMRNINIQNLIMGWRTSVGNGYEDGYVPEDTNKLISMTEFGFTKDARANLQVLMDATRGTTKYPSWANGTKLSGLAHYYRLTGDKKFVKRNHALVEGILEEFSERLATDPNGLLPPDDCCEDSGQEAYWFHGQSVAWRGMTDILPVLESVGRPQVAERYESAAEEFGRSLRQAIDDSAVRLGDGTLFIPERLLSGDQPYERITSTREGSYWNLLAPYGFASGILSDEQLQSALAYVHNHGGTMLGQTRFNWQGEPVGSCDPSNLPGYYGEGADELYGWQYARALADAGQDDRLNLMFYGKLAHSTTRNTFISGEGTDVQPCSWITYGVPGVNAQPDDPNEAVRLTAGYVNVPNATGLQFTGPFTLEAWVKPTRTQSAGIIERYDSPANNGYILRMVGGRLQAWLLGANGFNNVTGSKVVPVDGAWHQVAAVYDGGHLTLYVDGQKDGSVATTLTPGAGSGDLRLGARGDDAEQRFLGGLDEIAVYDHALTPDQLATHYEVAQSSNELYGGLVLDSQPAGYWKLDDSSGTFATDSSGDGHGGEYRPGQYYRQMWWSPMSTSGSVFLNALRQQLLHESPSTSADRTSITLAPATPRAWLADGKTIAVKELPTLVGPVTYKLTSALSEGVVRAELELPSSGRQNQTSLTLRVPGGHRMDSVWINGEPSTKFDAGRESIDLTGRTGEITVRVAYAPSG